MEFFQFNLFGITIGILSVLQLQPFQRGLTKAYQFLLFKREICNFEATL